MNYEHTGSVSPRQGGIVTTKNKFYYGRTPTFNYDYLKLKDIIKGCDNA